MTIPVVVTFQGVSPSAALHAEIVGRASGLDLIERGAVGCNVMIESMWLPGSVSERFCVNARLLFPDADLDDASPFREVCSHQDPFAAVNRTFDALQRRIEGPSRPFVEELAENSDSDAVEVR